MRYLFKDLLPWKYYWPYPDLFCELVYRAEFGLNWPLTEKQTAQLDRNQEVLVDLLEISPELIGQLYSRDAITRRHKEHICSISSLAFRNEAFLDILRRRSFWNYKQTIECLRTSQHRVTRKVADILEEGGNCVAFSWWYYLLTHDEPV